LIEAAAACGADAVKFQTHIAEAETLENALSPGYFSAEERGVYFRRTGFSLDQWRDLAAHATENRIEFLSSPFSIEAVELLEAVGVSAYKVPSGEVTNVPLLEYIAATGKPAYLSSGMSDWAELDAAVEVLRGCDRLVVMQCSSVYPCPPERVGLNVISQMCERYGLPVGFSDHTMGIAAPVAAAARGATVIEKHFTFSRLMYGSDAAHSAEPAEFAELASALREVWTTLDNPVDKDAMAPYAEMKLIFEKSIVTARALSAGTVLDREQLAFKKPGDGMSAARYRDVIGHRISRDLPTDHKLSDEDLV
jgi:N-acetylneuraminate synthase